MPEVQNFDCSSYLIYKVVNIKWGVEKSPNARMMFDRNADVRERGRKIHVIEKAVRKFFPCLGMIRLRPVWKGFQFR